MKLTIIGSGTCIPVPHRASPCLLLQSGGKNILCDTGPGTLRQLLSAGLSISAIDMLFYSHFHIDHTADFCPFLFASKYGQELVRNRELTIMGPTGLRQWYNGLCAVYGTWIVPERFSINWIETADESHAFDEFKITTAPVEHSGASIALRLEEPGGSSVAYSGDTDYCKGIIDICHNVDKAVLECSCPEEHKVEGHLTPTLAGRIARESDCKSLLLTHIYPEADRHDLMTPLRREYQGPAEVARDLITFTF